MSYYHREKKVDPRLIKPLKYPTLKVLPVRDEYIPLMLEDLRINPNLSIVRAMNYSRVLYGRLHAITLPKLLDYMEPLMNTSRAVVYFAKNDPSTFKGYCYKYSRFMHYILVSKFRFKCLKVNDITFDIVHEYLYSEARRGMQGSTVRGSLTAIRYMVSHLKVYERIKKENEIGFSQLFSFIDKNLSRPTKKRRAFGYTIMVRILDKIVFTVLLDVRDWCLIIILHVAGFRGGELATAKWADVIVDSYTNTFTKQKVNVLVIFLESTKTSNQSNDTVITISCPREHSSFNMLPVVKQYILLLKKAKRLNTWMFPSLDYKDRNKDKPITTATIRHITKKRVKQIGEDPKDFGAPSYRIAFVHDAIAAGILEEFIKKTGRWKSQCWRGYFHDAQYAQAMATSKMMDFGKQFETTKTTKKHRELATALQMAYGRKA